MKKYFHTKPLQRDLGLLLLRLMAGGGMIYAHGWGKMMRFIDGDHGFADVFGMGESVSLGLAVFGEAICSIFIVLGLFTRAALIPAIITMAVAVFYIHGDDPFSKQEMGLLYLVPYVALFLTGPGKLSLDKIIFRS